MMLVPSKLRRIDEDMIDEITVASRDMEMSKVSRERDL
jgi:hypothetical protein